MESKLLKIKLKNGTQGEVKKLVDKMNHDIDSPRKEMALFPKSKHTFQDEKSERSWMTQSAFEFRE